MKNAYVLSPAKKLLVQSELSFLNLNVLLINTAPTAYFILGA